MIPPNVDTEAGTTGDVLTLAANGMWVPGTPIATAIPTVDNASDLGDATHRWRRIYLGTSAIFQGAAFKVTLACTPAVADKTVTVPAETGTLDLLEIAQSFSGVKTFEASPLFTDNAVDLGDLTHRVRTLYAGTSIVIKGAAFKTTLTQTASADRAIAFPDAAGTVGLTNQLAPGAVRFGNSTTAAATSYLAPGHLEAASDATERVWVAPSAGTMRALYAHTSAAHGVGGETCTLTVRKNGADQAITVAFAAADTDVSDAAHTFAFAAGDRISVKNVTSGGGAVLLNVAVGLSYTLGA